MTKLKFPRLRETKVELESGRLFKVRPAVSDDVPPVTRLIHDAFEVWREKGLSLGPMFQTEEQTASYLARSGYVAEDGRRSIVGTFSVCEGRIRSAGPRKVRFSADGSSYLYARSGNAGRLPAGRLLVFRKAAVKRASAHAGLGRALYGLAEGLGREGGFAGMALETVKEAAWLYDWYRRLGFAPIGTLRFPGRTVDTVLMLKPF